MNGQRIRVTRKDDECSTECRIGNMFLVDSAWYGGVNVTSKSGVPLSLDKEECKFVNGEDIGHVADTYSYSLGVMDCFCETVSTGLKTPAMNHPYDTRGERDSYLTDTERLCRKYGVKFHPEDGIERLIKRAGTENQ